MVSIKTSRILSGSLKAVLLASAVLAAPAAWAQTAITLPLFGTVDAVVDWGAEGANASCQRAVTSQGEVTCNYPVGDGAGPFQVRISGTVTQFGNGDTGYANADKIVRVTRFGNVGLTSLSGAFKGAEKLVEVAADLPETVTDISYMFKDAVLLDDATVGNWGMLTRNVTNMTGTFENAVQFSKPLDGWCMQGRATPPAAFRALNKTLMQLKETQARLRAQGGNLSSISLSPQMKLDQDNEPKWGQCGVTIDATPPTAAQAGEAYSLDLRSRSSLWSNAPSGANVNNLSFQLVSGDLPPGMSLNGTTGLVSGTPSAAGTYNFTIRAFQN
jgi:hypothetical protein